MKARENDIAALEAGLRQAGQRPARQPDRAFAAGERIGAWLGIVGLAMQTLLVLAGALTWEVAVPVIHRVGGWGAPLGIDLMVNGLALAMLLLTRVVSLPLAIYARSYFPKDASQSRHFWPLADS